MKTILSLIIMMFLLVFTAAGAELVEFSDSSLTLTGGLGDTETTSTTLQNTGDEPVNVTFSGYTLINGSNSINLTAVTDEIDMLPTDTRTIDIEAIIPANQTAGDYKGTLTATTEESATDGVLVYVTVEENGGELELASGLGDQVVNPGANADAAFDIENKRNAEIVAVVNGTLTKGTDELTITQETKTFAAFETKTVTVRVPTDQKQPAGTYTGNIVFNYDDGTEVNVPYTVIVNELARYTVSGISEDMMSGETINKTITFTNTGNVDVTDITANYTLMVDDDTDEIKVTFYPTTVQLTGNTATMTVEIEAESEIDSDTYTSTMSFTSNEGANASAILTVEIDSILEIRKVDLTSDGTDDELKPGEELTLEIKILNTDNDIDLKDVDVVVRFKDGSRYLEDDDSDDIEEESDEFDLDADDDKTVTMTIKMPYEDVDDGDKYTIEVTVEGRNADDRSQRFTAVDTSEEIEFVKEDHEIKFTTLDIGPESLKCSRRASLDIGVQNIGAKNEDVQLVVKNSDLDLYILKTFELDKDPGDTDNEWDDTLSIDVDDDVDKGTYTIIVEAYFDDNDEVLRDSLTLKIEECASDNLNNGGNNNNNNNQQTTEGDFEVITTPPANNYPTGPTYSNTNIEKKSDGNATTGYVVALIILLLVLIVLVIWLGTVALKRN